MNTIMTIHYLGPADSYSHVLAKQLFPKQELSPAADFKSVVDQVLSDSENIGILPIENSITSNVHENIDHIFNYPQLKIIGEAYLQINLHLIGLKSAEIEQIKHIHSHAQALEQCRLTIVQHGWQTHALSSTAAAQQFILNKHDPQQAFIGNQALADHPQLQILVSDIGDNTHNLTRFVLISVHLTDLQTGKLPLTPTLHKERENRTKLTTIIRLKHEPGSLVGLLNQIAVTKANLTKIESRPIPGTDWEYDFWIDIDTTNIDKQKLIDIIDQYTVQHRVVGQYKQGDTYPS